MSKTKSTLTIKNKSFIVSVAISVLGLASGLILVRQNQQYRGSAQVTTSQPVLYFIPPEITVPTNTQSLTYDLYLDTNGFEVNNAVIEVNFVHPDENPPQLVEVTNMLEGEILSQVNSHLVSGGTAYLDIVTADDKPFVGEGIVATVEFKTFGITGTTTLEFGANTKIHTRHTQGGLPDGTPPGIIHVAHPTTPTPTINPTVTITPTPTVTPPLSAEAILLPETGQFNVGNTFPVSLYFNTNNQAISTVGLDLKYNFTDPSSPIDISNIQINQALLASGDWQCPITDITKNIAEIEVNIDCLNASTFGHSSNEFTLLATFDVTILDVPSSGIVEISFDQNTSSIVSFDSGENILVPPQSKGYYSIVTPLTPTPSPIPTSTPIPSPTPTPQTADASVLPLKEIVQAGDIIPASIQIDSASDGVSEISLLLYNVADNTVPNINISNININNLFSSSSDWDCVTQQPYNSLGSNYFGATCILINPGSYLYPNDTMFITFDLSADGITYSNPISIKVDSSSYLKDTQDNKFATTFNDNAAYFFCGADFNNDGKSNANDYSAWAFYYHPINPVIGGPAKGDFNCDGFVNAQDYSLWSFNYHPF